MKYRADIDGLRAVAVVLVLIFHGGFQFLPSGFIGVDIFFVISGYLISSIILQDLDRERFSFQQFYARRLWRLQPAVIAMLLATLAIALVIYIPNDFLDYVASAKSVSMFSANDYFRHTTTGYSTPDSAGLLLLHTWSLAIEWQWYLLMPAGLVVLHRLLSETRRNAVLYALTLLSVTLALFLSHRSPDKNYYYLTSRLFELLIGTSAMLLARTAPVPGKRLATLMGLGALLVLGVIALTSGILLGFPDYHALLVCLATAILLYLGAKNVGWSTRLLASRPLVAIGTLSYSLYLWHWPIFALGHYLDIQRSGLLTLASFALTFLVAMASYHGVEKRFRHSRLSPAKTFLLLFATPALACSLLVHVAKHHEGFPDRFHAEMARIDETLDRSVPRFRESCLKDQFSGPDSHCVIGAASAAQPNTLLIGDSYANHSWGFLDVLSKDAGLQVQVEGTSACLALPDIYLYDFWKYRNSVYRNCHDNAKKYYEQIASAHYKYVIIGQRWVTYDGDNAILDASDKHPQRSQELSHQHIKAAFDHALQIITASGATPVVVKSFYPMPENFFGCFYKHIELRRELGASECSEAPLDTHQDEWFSSLFNEFKLKYPALIIIDPKDVQCRNGTCMTHLDGIPVYRDIGHMTDYASYAFGQLYLRQFSNPFK